MTLCEQIISIHARTFNKAFHDHREGNLSRMTDDLAMKFFDKLFRDPKSTPYWYIYDNVDLRAVKKVREMFETSGSIPENTPAVQ